MKSIELTQVNQEKVTIFPEKMCYIKVHVSGGTEIGFASTQVVVIEDYQDVLNLLKSPNQFFTF